MAEKNIPSKKAHHPTTAEDEITETLLEFPCDFPIKVMGEEQADLTEVIVGVIQSVLPDFDHTKIEKRASSGGRYLSLTCTVHVTSKPQLDAVYMALSKHPIVKFVL
jgi:putative lipoic acid-binding regulatory protein